MGRHRQDFVRGPLPQRVIDNFANDGASVQPRSQLCLVAAKERDVDIGMLSRLSTEKKIESPSTSYAPRGRELTQERGST